MNPTKVYLPIIAILVAIIVLQRSCTPKCPTAIVTVIHDTIHDIHHDTVIKTKLAYKEIPSKSTIKHDTIYHVTTEQIDTSLVQDVVDDWYTTRIYADTSLSKYGKFLISDTVFQNKLHGRRIIANWNVPIAINNSTMVLPQKFQVYVGGTIGSNSKVLGFGPDLLIKTKRDAIYSVGALYIPGDIGLFYHVSSYWKIHFK